MTVDHLKNFWQECSTFEKCWCVTFTAVGIFVSIVKDTPLLNMTATILGMWCVFLVAKCHIFNFYVGSVYVSIHAYISFQYDMYFMTCLYVGFYLPLQYVGWKIWSQAPPLYQVKNEQIAVKHLFPRGWLAVTIALIILSLIYIQILQIYYQSEKLPWDSLWMVMGVSGQLLMTWRFVEQWVAWIGINVINSVMWLMVLYENPMSNDAIWIFLSMWLLKIINAIYGWYNWKVIQKQQSKLVGGPYCPYQPQFTRRY